MWLGWSLPAVTHRLASAAWSPSGASDRPLPCRLRVCGNGSQHPRLHTPELDAAAAAFLKPASQIQSSRVLPSASGAIVSRSRGVSSGLFPPLELPTPTSVRTPTIVTRWWPCARCSLDLPQCSSFSSVPAGAAWLRPSPAAAWEPPPAPRIRRGYPAARQAGRHDRLGGVSARPFFPWDRDESFSSGCQGALSSPR